MDAAPSRAAIQTAPPPPRHQPTPAALPWSAAAQWTLAAVVGLSVLSLSLYCLLTGSRTTPTHLQGRPSHTVDLNRADRAVLSSVPEVGDVLADRIVEYRRTHGPFRTPEELDRVPGIGPGKLRSILPHVYVAEDDAGGVPIRPVSMSGQPSVIEPSDKVGTLDVNTAGEEQLQQLPGVGPIIARRIIDARRQAPFRTVDDLRRVPGIGPKTLEKLRPHVIVKPAPGNRAA